MAAPIRSGAQRRIPRPDPDQPWASAADILPYRGTSAGGGDSTVTDLLHFAAPWPATPCPTPNTPQC
jgi:hypothetical protein